MRLFHHFHIPGKTFNPVAAWIIIFLIAGNANSNAQSYPDYVVSVRTDASSGYYFLSAFNADKRNKAPSIGHHMIIDSAGFVVFTLMRPINEKQFTCDFKLHPDGTLSYYFNDKFYVMDRRFRVSDSIYCRNGIKRDSHELLMLPNGNRVLFGIEEPVMDLRRYHLFEKSQQPGSENATVTCGVIQEQNRHGDVVFEWHSRDYFAFDNVDTFFISNPLRVDWTHFNSIDIDTDGSYIVSARNFNEVTKISRRDGHIIWRLGGKRNQFRFINDSVGFVAQHDARRHSDGSLTLYNNRREKPAVYASAKSYQINEADKTAELSWQFTDSPARICAEGLGNVQRLSNGNTLVNHGICVNKPELFVVVDPSGVKVFELAFENAMRSYRVYCFQKLPSQFVRPKIEFRAVNGKYLLRSKREHAAYYWSTGETTREIEVTERGRYELAVPAGGAGFLVARPLFF